VLAPICETETNGVPYGGVSSVVVVVDSVVVVVVSVVLAVVVVGLAVADEAGVVVDVAAGEPESAVGPARQLPSTGSSARAATRRRRDPRAVVVDGSERRGKCLLWPRTAGGGLDPRAVVVFRPTTEAAESTVSAHLYRPDPNHRPCQTHA